MPELEDRKTEAEWNETAIESDNSLPSSSGCSLFPAEAGPENDTSHVPPPPKTNDDLSATGNLSLFEIQGPADWSTVSRNGELQAEHEGNAQVIRFKYCWPGIVWQERIVQVGNAGREKYFD